MKNRVIIISVMLCTLPWVVSAETIAVGSEMVTYTNVYQDVPGVSSYYDGDDLVLSAYDSDDDGNPDQWVFYGENLSVTREMKDTDGNGEPDLFFTFDKNEEVTSMVGDGLTRLQTPDIEPLPPVEERNESNPIGDEDLAGDLENIQSLAGEGGLSAIEWLLLVAFLAGGYWWWKRKK